MRSQELHALTDIGLSIYKNNHMKLIYIKSTMEPKNYSTIRSILKSEQGEKIAPYVFKISDTKAIQEYLDKEKITYEIYQQLYVNSNRSINTTYQEDISGRSQQELTSKKRELSETSQEQTKILEEQKIA